MDESGRKRGGERRVEYKGPRLAPGPDVESEPKLDAVVVIPAMDEGVNIIDTIESVAQQRKAKRDTFIQGAVVVINNRPDSPPDVLKSNMRTYTLLQGIRYGVQLKIDGRRDLTEKIRAIQKSGLRIEVVDAFSPGHAHEKSNVGMARRLGTEEALKHVREDQSAIISTDADTVVGRDTLATIRKIFATEEVDMMPLHAHKSIKGLDARSLRSAQLYGLFWGVRTIIINFPSKIQAIKQGGFFPEKQPESEIMKQAIWTAGASTTFTAGAYRGSTGYRDVGTAEDNVLAADVVRSGARLKDLRSKYPQIEVFTQHRISKRTDFGFGHRFAQLDEVADKPFSALNTTHPYFEKKEQDFFLELDKLKLEKKDRAPDKQDFDAICRKYGMSEEIISSLWDTFQRWNGTPNTEEHYKILHDAQGFMRKNAPEVPMMSLIEQAEDINRKYSDAVLAAKWGEIEVGVSDEYWKWSEFQKILLEDLTELGIPVDDPDIHSKLRAAIAWSYAYHFDPLVLYHMGMYAQVILDKAIADNNLTPEQRQRINAAGGHETRFEPEEFDILNLQARIGATISILETSKELFRDSLPKDAMNRVDDDIAHLRDEFNKAWNKYERGKSKNSK